MYLICISFVRFLKIATLIMFILLFFSFITKTSKLNESQIQILIDHYARHFDAWEALGYVYNALIKHGDEMIEMKYYIYRALCTHLGTIVENYPNKFVCDLNSRNNYLLFNEINENCFIKVLKTIKVPKDKYNDALLKRFIVYK